MGAASDLVEVIERHLKRIYGDRVMVPAVLSRRGPNVDWAIKFGNWPLIERVGRHGLPGVKQMYSIFLPAARGSFLWRKTLFR